MTAMPCGRKKHSNAASQSHRATGPLVAIEETVLRLRTATTNNSAKSHRPNSRRRALVELALTGQPKLSFMVGGRFETCGICCPRPDRYQETRLYSTSGPLPWDYFLLVPVREQSLSFTVRTASGRQTSRKA